jgi:hypothetical protein
MTKLTSNNLYYEQHTEQMISYRDMNSLRVYQWNGSKRNMTKLNNFVVKNWSEDLTADEIFNFAATLKNTRHYSRSY